MKTLSKHICLLLLMFAIILTITCNPVYSQSKDTLKNSEMKVIGIIGGVSWASSIEYYKLMNEMVRDRFGSLYSANILMYSIPFKEFSDQERLAEAGDALDGVRCGWHIFFYIDFSKASEHNGSFQLFRREDAAV